MPFVDSDGNSLADGTIYPYDPGISSSGEYGTGTVSGEYVLSVDYETTLTLQDKKGNKITLKYEDLKAILEFLKSIGRYKHDDTKD